MLLVFKSLAAPMIGVLAVYPPPTPLGPSCCFWDLPADEAFIDLYDAAQLVHIIFNESRAHRDSIADIESFRPGSPAWPASIGMGGRLPSESVAGLPRNQWPLCVWITQSSLRRPWEHGVELGGGQLMDRNPPSDRACEVETAPAAPEIPDVFYRPQLGAGRFVCESNNGWHG